MVTDEVATWMKIIRAEDPIAAVLRAHLWVETDLNALLRIKTHKDWSRKVYGKQFDYFDKVRIALAFDLVMADLFEALQNLGQLRNDLAHKMGYELTHARQHEFLDKIPDYYIDRCRKVIATILTADFTDSYGDNIQHIEGLEGKRALSQDFLIGLLAIHYDLSKAYEDIRTDYGLAMDNDG